MNLILPRGFRPLCCISDCKDSKIDFVDQNAETCQLNDQLVGDTSPPEFGGKCIDGGLDVPFFSSSSLEIHIVDNAVDDLIGLRTYDSKALAVPDACFYRIDFDLLLFR
jgi:hypothetical protein